MAQDDHTYWEELAVGHALSALEPADEEAFVRHVRTCARCERTVAEASEVMAALAGAAEQADPPESLRDDILARAHAVEPGSGEQPSGEPVDRRKEDSAGEPEEASPGRRGRRREGSRGAARGNHRERGTRLPWYALAAAVVIVIALAVGNVVQFVGGGEGDGGDGGDAGRRQLAEARQVVSCVERQDCRTVPLRATEGGSVPAIALVQDGRVQLVVDGLQANDANATMYVLWQKSGGELRPVGAFDVTESGTTVIRGGGLAAPLSQIGLLAISHEHGDTVPRQPSSPIAVGTVSP